MSEFLSNYPWLIIPCMALLIPIVAIIFGTVTSYLRKTRQAELDAALKQEMLQRGMSAEEIVQVINARTDSWKRRCSTHVPSQEMAEHKHC